uniref:Uncharacterized protein n=1 Tax=Ditylenchus dipsaci TaxID=166011 RepID=A0A915EN31_9BILA
MVEDVSADHHETPEHGSHGKNDHLRSLLEKRGERGGGRASNSRGQLPAILAAMAAPAMAAPNKPRIPGGLPSGPNLSPRGISRQPRTKPGNVDAYCV